uniref:Uncharacterized protein n=1 Tax=Amblyomma cajennense TaxID=34607 RepID=A0A023FET1_AMBCJ
MNEVKDSEDYYCPQCSRPDTAKATGRSNGSSQEDMADGSGGGGEELSPESSQEFADSSSPAAAAAEEVEDAGASVATITKPPAPAAPLVSAAV